MLRIAFMGTPDFTIPVLESLVQAPGCEVVAVFCQPPKPQGRGYQIQKCPVHLAAEQMNIPVFTPQTLKDEQSQKLVKDLHLDVMIVYAYGLILPKAVLSSARHGCFNIHVSLLPRWRGAAPVQRALLAGDSQTGVTLMQMDEGLDTGDIIFQEAIDLDESSTSQKLYGQLTQIGSKLTLKLIQELHTGHQLQPQIQEHLKATYAAKLAREDGLVDFEKMTAQEIDRRYRALYPWPGLYFDYQGEHIKIHELALSEFSQAPTSGTAAEIVSIEGDILCKDQTCLRLRLVQRPNKPRIAFKDLMSGYRLHPGDCLVTK